MALQAQKLEVTLLAFLTACVSTGEKPLSRDLHPTLSQKLTVAWTISMAAVREKEGCAALIGGGKRAVTVLRLSVYLPGSPEFCSAKNLVAYNVRGTPYVYLCPVTMLFTERRLATTIIHEAIHVAGVPHDDTNDWTNVISEVCGTGGHGDENSPEREGFPGNNGPERPAH